MNEKIKKIFRNLNILFSDMVEDKKWNESELKISQREVGGKVELVSQDGQLAPAPDGDYEMEDGFKFTVKDGAITAIEGQEQPEEEAVETSTEEKLEESTEETVAEAPADDLKAKVDSIEQSLLSLGDAVAALSAKVDELAGTSEVAATKEEVSEFTKQVADLHSTIKELAKVPVEFSKTTSSNTVKDSKDEKLFELGRIISGAKKKN